jgi:hypothetical protein
VPGVTCRWRRHRPSIAAMRDLDAIDSELRLLVAVRRGCRELDGRVPSTGPVDALLDERSAAGLAVAVGEIGRRGEVADATHRTNFHPQNAH